MTTATISAWLLTYLLHSTIILIAALVLSRLMGGRNLAVQEGMLRTALIGGILTASVQLGFGISPAAGNFALDSVTAPVPGVVADFQPTNGEAVAQPSTVNPVRASGLDWTTALIVLWLVTSISALVVVLRSVLDLKRLLRTRCFQPAGHMIEKLAAAMGLRRRVKVSTSRAIAVPFATGITQPEICCPERVNELAREHQRGLYAHELAHLVRRDPAWQLLYRLGEAVFSLQPLNRLVRRRLEEIAEHLTDERAVAGTGDRLGLARCLVVVAHWRSAAPVGLPATTFAAGPRLDRRIRRLLSGTTDHHVNGGWVVATAVALLIGSVSILPAIGATPAQAEVNSTPSEDSTSRTLTTEETKAGSDVTNGRTWSTTDERPKEDPPPPAEPQVLPMHVFPAPDAVPEPAAGPASKAPPVPEAAPVSKVAPAPGVPPARPATAAPPMPSAEPAPAAAPKQPAPSVTPQQPETERTSEEQEARERARQRAEQRVRVQEEQRSRAEAMVRERRIIAREQAESARKMAEEAARRSRVFEADHREISIQIRERQAVAQREARELSLAERDRARALAEEARAAAPEAIVDTQRLTDEQREELLLQAVELREQVALRDREIAEAAKARARALADEARRLAEQAEAERLEREKKDR